MPIKNRDLEAGTRLVASYKKQSYFCDVVQDGEKTLYVLEDGRRFKSPSAAGSALMDGKAVNGWRFWSLAEVQSLENRSNQKGAEQRQPRSAAKSRTNKRMIYRLPNQNGLEAGMSRYFCNGCQKSFIVATDVTPEACPEGHRASEPTNPTAPASDAGKEVADRDVESSGELLDVDQGDVAGATLG